MFDAIQLELSQIADLVPDCYAAFRSIVVDAIAFFLERLSPARLARVIESQAMLPADAPPAQRIVQFMYASPALHKLGQVVARRHELDKSLRRRLQGLESMAPKTPIAELLPIVQDDLRDAINEYQIEFADAALAEASVAVVLPLTWGEPGSRQRREGVVKVLRPGVVELLDEDLEILSRLADFLDERREHYRLPAIDYGDTFDEVRRLLTHEVRVTQEQENLSAAAEQYADDPRVLIPKLLPFCTERTTAMERVHGVKVTDISELAVVGEKPPPRPSPGVPGEGEESPGVPGEGAETGRLLRAGEAARRSRHRGLARLLADALVADVLFSRRPTVRFHGDCHAGNLFATEDGRLALLDWSLAGRLSLSDREQIAQVLVGAMARDVGRIVRAVRELAEALFDEAKVAGIVRRALDSLRPLAMPGPMWLMRLLDSTALAGVKFSADLMLFRKSFFMLEGVFADVCSECCLEEILISETMAKLAADWPMRAILPPTSRALATHISTADLMDIFASAAGQWARMWTGVASARR